jgi:hypothetical protein
MDLKTDNSEIKVLSEESSVWWNKLLSDDEREILEKGIDSMLYNACQKALQRARETARRQPIKQVTQSDHQMSKVRNHHTKIPNDHNRFPRREEGYYEGGYYPPYSEYPPHGYDEMYNRNLNRPRLQRGVGGFDYHPSDDDHRLRRLDQSRSRRNSKSHSPEIRNIPRRDEVRPTPYHDPMLSSYPDAPPNFRNRSSWHERRDLEVPGAFLNDMHVSQANSRKEGDRHEQRHLDSHAMVENTKRHRLSDKDRSRRSERRRRRSASASSSSSTSSRSSTMTQGSIPRPGRRSENNSQLSNPRYDDSRKKRPYHGENDEQKKRRRSPHSSSDESYRKSSRKRSRRYRDDSNRQEKSKRSRKRSSKSSRNGKEYYSRTSSRHNDDKPTDRQEKVEDNKEMP